jgi:hypothetical protein
MSTFKICNIKNQIKTLDLDISIILDYYTYIIFNINKKIINHCYIDPLPSIATALA